MKLSTESAEQSFCLDHLKVVKNVDIVTEEETIKWKKMRTMVLYPWKPSHDTTLQICGDTFNLMCMCVRGCVCKHVCMWACVCVEYHSIASA